MSGNEKAVPWPQHLILVGPMGAGKSCIGRTVAASLRLPFVDTDELVVNAAGMSIPQIFETSGEEAFRHAETLAVKRLMYLPDSVIATGGGAVMREENWAYMLACGLVVRLVVSPEESFRRTRGGLTRPMLGVPDRLERLRELAQVRDPLYALANLTVISEGRPITEVAAEVVEAYLEWKAALDS